MTKNIVSFNIDQNGEPCTKVRIFCNSPSENKKAREELETIRINKAYSFVTFVFTSCEVDCVEAYIKVNAIDELEKICFSF
jgi:hypothetical protein